MLEQRYYDDFGSECHEIHNFQGGRFPVKTAAAILKVIESAGNNGEALHIDIENWRIAHIAASRGVRFESRFPRARGRATPKMRESANVEVVLEEVK